MATDLISAIKEKQTLIAKLQSELDEAKALLLGEQIVEKPKPVARASSPIRRTARHTKAKPMLPYKSGSSVGRAAKILMEAGSPLHVDELLSRMKGKIPKPTLVGNLSRYVKEGKIFTRTGPGTFGLLEWTKTESKAEETAA